MKMSNVITFLLLAAFFVASCHKSSVQPIQPGDHIDPVVSPPSAADFAKLRADALEKATQKYQVNLDTVSGNFEFTSNSGTQVSINANSLFLNGQSVDGEVEIHFVEIYNAGQMAALNKVTMGFDVFGNLSPIITGGAFYINVYQNGQELDGNGFFNLKVPSELTGDETVDTDMKLWKGSTDSLGNLAWDEVNPDTGAVQGANGKGEIVMQDSVYNVFYDQFGWTNIDKFASYDGPKTKMKATVPEGYGPTNAVVYLKYTGEANALARLDSYDSTDHYFTEHYGWIPIGEKISLIFASATEEGQWLVAIKKNITVQDHDVYTFKLSEMETLNDDEALTQKINSLP